MSQPIPVPAFTYDLGREKPSSWKYVFNADLAAWGYCDRARDAARALGYPYFVWNGRVYAANEWCTDTHVLAKDLS